ncbi:sialate O-acetylesterase [Undibacterium squillarum]|uniref:Sialate O-acetylesterase domain-containing protein n=1 Tax=Undibacterium squillarum TaxID=1131567 RepID=A0ABQ2XW81_9BURK|nr:sialate O-acetylesterase [Undibacterium squillarum]GGX35568.1 hypothetical protein GCM10010946_11300 [Undibacterium squillarum]
MTPRRWFVLVIAGQSNAQGFAEALPEPADLEISERICQLGRYRGMRPDGAREDRWNKILPATHVLDDVKDMRFANRRGNTKLRYSGTIGPGLFIARRLLPLLPEDYGILLLPQAHGGAGMVTGQRGTYLSETESGQYLQPGASVGRAVYHYPGVADQNSNGAMCWGCTDAPLYLDTLHRIRYALNLHPDNRLLGVVWCQGESDAHAGTEAARRHGAAFTAMLDRFGKDLADHQAQMPQRSWDAVPWLLMAATYWWDDCKATHAMVLNTYRRLARQRPQQCIWMDMRLQSDGQPQTTNADFWLPAHQWPVAAQADQLPAAVTDARTCPPEMAHIHLSAEAYRGEVSARLAAALRPHLQALLAEAGSTSLTEM